MTVLPSTVGGAPLETIAVSGAQVDSVLFGGVKIIASNLGVDTASMKVVLGRSAGAEVVTVVQVPGMDTASLIEAVRFGVGPVSVLKKAGAPATVGGKDVLAFSGSFLGQPVITYVYVTGDAIFVVDPGVPAAVAEELLAALP